jgi:hypothetical protein
MDHDRLGRRRAGGGAAGPALGRHALALDQKNGLIAFGAKPSAIAFNKHVSGSIRNKEERSKINIALLETT